MTSSNFSRRLLWLAASLASSAVLLAQTNHLSVAQPSKVVVKPGGTAEITLDVRVADGYHVNSDKPAEDYLIPLRLTWQPGALTAGDITYPKPQLEKYEFSAKPLSVFAGSFRIVAQLKADASAAPGAGTLFGKLRYQACSDNTCFRPTTVEIRLPYEIQ